MNPKHPWSWKPARPGKLKRGESLTKFQRLQARGQRRRSGSDGVH